MVAFKNVAALLVLTACPANIVQAQPLDRATDNSGASLALSSIPDDSTSSTNLYERNYDDANAALSEFFVKKMPIPALCVGVVLASRSIIVTWTTPEQRQAAYACIARQLNHILPAGRQVTGEDVEMNAHRVGDTVEEIARPTVNGNGKKMV